MKKNAKKNNKSIRHIKELFGLIGRKKQNVKTPLIEYILLVPSFALFTLYNN